MQNWQPWVVVLEPEFARRRGCNLDRRACKGHRCDELFAELCFHVIVAITNGIRLDSARGRDRSMTFYSLSAETERSKYAV